MADRRSVHAPRGQGPRLKPFAPASPLRHPQSAICYTPSAVVQAKPPQTMFTQYRSDSLRRALEALHHTVSGVRASVIANVDGLLVMSYPPGDDDYRDPTSAEPVAAMSAVILGLAERTLERLAQGGVERVIIEGDCGVVGVFPVADDAALAVLYAKDAKLGLALNATRRCADEVRGILKR